MKVEGKPMVEVGPLVRQPPDVFFQVLFRGIHSEFKYRRESQVIEGVFLRDLRGYAYN